MWKLAVLALLAGSVAVAQVKPAVSVGTVQVTAGTYDAARARKVLATAEPKVLGCYTSLVGAPYTGIVATAKLKLAANGKVSAVTVRGLASSETDPVHNCVADVLSKLRFAAPKAGEVVDLEAPFAFAGSGTIAGIRGDAIFERDGDGTPGITSLATGRYGTIGGGGGVGVGTLRGKRATVPTPTLGLVTVTGALDKAIVRRFLKRNLMKLQYCYEKELRAAPGLEGIVRMELVIAPDGTVQTAAATGLGNANVEGCIAGVLQGIAFPKPKGPAVTVVVPLTLRSNAP